MSYLDKRNEKLGDFKKVVISTKVPSTNHESQVVFAPSNLHPLPKKENNAIVICEMSQSPLSVVFRAIGYLMILVEDVRYLYRCILVSFY